MSSRRQGVMSHALLMSFGSPKGGRQRKVYVMCILFKVLGRTFSFIYWLLKEFVSESIPEIKNININHKLILLMLISALFVGYFVINYCYGIALLKYGNECEF